MKKRRFLSLLLSAALLAGLLAVPASAAGQPYIKQVEAGNRTSWAVTSNGDLYGWGSCDTSTLLNGDTTSNVPVKIMSGVKSVSASSSYCTLTVRVKVYDEYGYNIRWREPGTVLTILKENGDLYTWGDNVCYQLGKGYYEADVETYEPYFVMGNVVKAATNDHACAAVTENGDLYFWGDNFAEAYANGKGGCESYTDPTVILTGVKDVELSPENVMALKNDGSVWMMGTNIYGVLGRDEGEDAELVNEMIKVMDGCVDIALGNKFAMALKPDGSLYGWGNNSSYAALGFHWNLVDYVATPTLVATDVRSVDAGNNNAYFIKFDDTLWVTGAGQHGQRGPSSINYHYDSVTGEYKLYNYYPEIVDTNVHSVSGGGSHMLYLKNDGTMWGCGMELTGSRPLGRGDGADEWGEIYILEDGHPSHSAYRSTPTLCGLSYGSFAGMFGPVQEEVELVAGFADIAANAWYRDAVEWAVNEGITSGTGDITFSPDRNCTRAEILTFLWRANGSPSADGDASFDDVAANAYYADAAAWAAEEGIVLGDHLDPDAPCTRAMAVDFLWRANGCPAMALGAPFDDVPEGSPYIGAVEWAVAWNITTGTDEDHFSPDTICNRAQIVTFLYRTYKE